MKILKNYLIILFSVISAVSFGQVRIVNSISNTAASSSSAFIDASSNNSTNSTSNIGKGLLYPRVNLTTFAAFSGAPAGIATSYPSRFDGMVVYNTTTGIAGIGGTIVNPGFYYYSNQTTNVNGGKWVRINDGNITSTPNGTEFPTVPQPNAGDVFYRTDSQDYYFYNGSSWIGASTNFSGSLTGDVSGTQVATVIGEGKVTNSMLAGSIAFSKLVGTDITTIGTLTAGSVPYTLLTGTVPTWNQNTTGNAATATSAVTAVTATNLSGGLAGEIPYQTASGTTALLAAGISGQVLTSNGNEAPTWSNMSAGPLNVTSEKTGNYTALATDDIILYNASAPGLVLTLPTTGVEIGKKIYVSNMGVEMIGISPAVREISNQNLQGLQASILMYIGGTGAGSWSIMTGF